ncbi:MAG: hypothetical protein DMG69_31200 [Acidobacteria bacterium]|nr:MAG: hypothetical protein DMG69_31200 [Acidobacteriota bacterium]
MRLLHRFILALTILLSSFVLGQEAPYFVTYDHHLEEPRNLEIATSSTIGVPGVRRKAYLAPYMELEYGAKAWWTTEFYLESQSTRGDSTVFTGWRWENRFRALAREHWINPVLYIEYENVNEATRIQKEVVGKTPDFGVPNAELVRERSHELETKLILSSNTHAWNLSENFIVEKNLSASEGFEFGYAVGASRPLSTMASAQNCRFCRENFAAGLELYGGLGGTDGFGLHNTTHYLGPVISWQVSDNAALHFSPAFGLTRGRNPVLLRLGYSYEVRGFGRKMARLFGGKP